MAKRIVSKEEAVKLNSERIQATFQLDPAVKITLRGKEYTLELTNYAVKGLYKDTGHNLLSLGFTLEAMQSAELLGALLYWSLNYNHPDLTQDDVDKLFSYRLYGYILDRLKVVVDLFLPDMSDVQIEGARPEASKDEDPT
jgi:hypothetical protein